MKFSSACLLLGIMAAKAFVPMKAGNRFASLLKMSEDRGSITRGDTRGAALLVEDVSVSRGDTQILTKVQWRVEPTAKWALVGANGAGKSTLLKTLMGELFADDGKIMVGTTQQVGYLQQTAVSGSDRTIFEEAASAMTAIANAQAALEKATILVGEDPSEEHLNQLTEATEAFEAAGGYTQEQEVGTVLKGLGFKDIHRKCSELSGGWQMRVSLARLLLSKPSLLLLDEPSNHLDVNARQWLGNYLKNYDDGAMILVTHDVDLLNSVSHIAEVQAGTLMTYKSCTYEQFLNEKEFRAMAAQNEYLRNKEKADKLQAFVDRFGASATKAASAQSRVKALEKMKAEGLLDAPPEAVMQKRFKPTLRLPPPPRSIGEVLMALEGAKVGHGEKTLVSNVNLEVKRGMKLLLRGPNGVGKSTILHSLRGTLPLQAGERNTNEQLRLGVFTQDLAQELDANSRAVDLVTAYARQDDINISDQDARSVMGMLGLTGNKSIREIKNLSGGEKARVALAMFAMKASNVILLDEPSNHLDVECIEALGESLSSWGKEDGAIVVISHDQEFCKMIPFTHVGTVDGGKLVLEERETRPSDWELFDGIADTIGATPSPNGESTGARNDVTKATVPKKELDPKMRKQAYNAPKRIEKIEQLIKQAEKNIEDFDSEMISIGSDVGKLAEFSKKKIVAEQKVAELMKEWEELEELLAVVA